MSIKKIYALFIALAAYALQGHAQTRIAFVQQEVARKPVTTTYAFSLLSLTDKQTTRVYLDGFGRTVQTIGVQASPAQNDMIQPVVYDALGRKIKGYLGYAGQSTDTIGRYRSNALTAQRSFYNNTSQYLIARDTNAFVQQVYESSPLQRPLKSGTVGVGFQPTGSQHFKTASYRSNNTTQDGNILLWNTDGTLTASTYYAANTLSVTEAMDEDSAKVITYTDPAGHTVLKRQKLDSGNLDTYYIYNNGGAISYIVPPKALALLLANSSYTLATTPLSNLVFKYTYDGRGRVISKKVPAKGTSYMVYDPLGRPVLTQDALQAVANKWSYIKYDAKGRPVATGIYLDNTTSPTSHIGQANMQAYVNTLSYTTWYESRSGTLTNNGYYTNNVFPTTNLTPLAYSYYDDYDLNQDGNDDFFYAKQSDTALPGEDSVTRARLKGVPTITAKALLAQPGTSIENYWLTTATFYDNRLNPIQVRSNNHLYHPGDTVLTDVKTVTPSFAGVPQASKVRKQYGASGSVTVYTYMTYDHMYRVTDISQKYNTGSKTSVAAYSYNEIGQVIKKNLGYVSAGVWLQNLDMRYSIRGQLLSINNSKLASDTGRTNNDINDVFGMQMVYDQYDAKLNNRPRYNGMLTGVKWMNKDGSGGSSYERAYRYFYDRIGRDTAAIYAERTTSGTGNFSVTHGWDENRITYDEGGNILTMFRDSTSQGSGGHTPIDNLTYAYDSSSPNRLLSVTDGSGSAYTNSGFRNRTGSTGNYTYDANGNLTADPYKGISSISYNAINLTFKLSFSANRYIYFNYDAGGQLIRKQQYDNVSGVATLIKTTDYIDGFVFEGSALQYFPMPEGRVIYSGGTFTREFIITDQQGNARISFNNTGTGGTVKVVQENSYYAYGLVMPGGTVTSGSNKKLYNGGSEWQNDYANLPDYYQTFFRNYDAALGRWVAVDPIPESAIDLSPYQYGNNNPVMFNDPLGDKVQTEIDNSSSYYPWSGHQSIFGSNISPDMRQDGELYSQGRGGGNYSAVWTDRLRGVGSNTDDIVLALETEQIVYRDGQGGSFVVAGYGYYNGQHESITGSNGQDIGNCYPIFVFQAAAGLGGNAAGTYKEGWFPGKGAIDFLQGFTASGQSDLNARSSWAGYMSAEGTMINLGLRQSAKTVGIGRIARAEVLRDALHANVAGYALGTISIGFTLYEDSQRKQGITAGTWVKSTIYSLEMAFPVAGLAYAAFDLGVGVFTGKTITERIGDGVDNVINHN